MKDQRTLIFAIAVLVVMSVVGLRFAERISSHHQGVGTPATDCAQ